MNSAAARRSPGLTRSQVATRLGCSLISVRRLQDTGALTGERDRTGVFLFDAAHVERVRVARTRGEQADDAREREHDRSEAEAHDARVRADERKRVLAEVEAARTKRSAAPVELSFRERHERRRELLDARMRGGTKARDAMAAVHELRDTHASALRALQEDPSDEEARNIVAGTRELLEALDVA